MFKKTILTTTFAAVLAFSSQQANATIVLVETNMGDFEINLFDQTTPKTVTNFLNYVKDGSYDNVVFHRSVKDFVVQGGGFRYSGNNTSPFAAVATRGPVDNEPKLSNVRGTVAMAKVADSPNSATNQWFVNLGNNASNLDRQNSGFTVFGVVTGTGMSILDSIEDLYVPATGNFAGAPLRNYSATDLANNVALTASNLVVIEKITVINDSPTTAANLNPAPNTLAGQQTDSSSSGGGSMGSALLLALAGLAFWRRRKV
ncbi:LPXTG cell wall anchor domain-containing protein [Rheinheimera sediminis]|uniref:peptidylprolyl isomerase n=1 Tax=Rheinheimera sp. YQF-1 TaxID=2499626 RepID=UPI000FD772E1|nr:peptidylprolyl isomerase [Rheinheimera sp. YQF-1]RVT47527.1 LPXTG cell wall anchor domain-containing protein [Rheinheimera sp. YQF-1]